MAITTRAIEPGMASGVHGTGSPGIGSVGASEKTREKVVNAATPSAKQWWYFRISACSPLGSPWTKRQLPERVAAIEVLLGEVGEHARRWSGRARA